MEHNPHSPMQQHTCNPFPMKWGSKPIWLACQAVWMFVCNDQALWQEVQVKWQEIWWGKGIKAWQYRFWKLFLQKSIMISSEKFVPIQSTYWEKKPWEMQCKISRILILYMAHSSLFVLIVDIISSRGRIFDWLFSCQPLIFFNSILQMPIHICSIVIIARINLLFLYAIKKYCLLLFLFKLLLLLWFIMFRMQCCQWSYSFSFCLN